MERTAVDRGQVRRELGWYLLATFVPTLALAALAAGQGGLGKFPAAVLAMFVPMLAAMLVQKRVARQPVFKGGLLGFRVGRISWWLIAPVSAGVLVGLSFLISFLLTPDLLATGEALSGNLSKLPGVPDLGLSPEARTALLILVALFLGSFFNLPVYLGEEVGWRGFMTPRLTLLYGRRGVLLAGLIWGVWHTPLILLGHNYPHHPLLGHLVWLPLCICFSILLQAAYGAGRSIFVPALAHGAINQVAGVGMMTLFLASNAVDWLHGPVGLAGLTVFIAPAMWVYLRRPDLLVAASRLPGTPQHNAINGGEKP